MRIVRLDATHSSMDAIYTEIDRVLEFPYFGRNLDALWDIMHDVPGPIEIRWQGHEEARKRLGDPSFEALVKLFRDLERDRSDFRFVLEHSPSGRT